MEGKAKGKVLLGPKGEAYYNTDRVHQPTQRVQVLVQDKTKRLDVR